MPSVHLILLRLLLLRKYSNSSPSPHSHTLGPSSAYVPQRQTPHSDSCYVTPLSLSASQHHCSPVSHCQHYYSLSYLSVSSTLCSRSSNFHTRVPYFPQDESVRAGRGGRSARSGRSSRCCRSGGSDAGEGGRRRMWRRVESRRLGRRSRAKVEVSVGCV